MKNRSFILYFRCVKVHFQRSLQFERSGLKCTNLAKSTFGYGPYWIEFFTWKCYRYYYAFFVWVLVLLQSTIFSLKSGGSNTVVTYDIIRTQGSSLCHESSLLLSESSQCRQFQSRKSPEFFESSLCQKIITKMSDFLRVACLAG